MGHDNQPTTIRLPNEIRELVKADGVKKGLPLATMIKTIVCERYTKK